MLETAEHASVAYVVSLFVCFLFKPRCFFLLLGGGHFFLLRLVGRAPVLVSVLVNNVMAHSINMDLQKHRTSKYPTPTLQNHSRLIPKIARMRGWGRVAAVSQSGSRCRWTRSTRFGTTRVEFPRGGVKRVGRLAPCYTPPPHPHPPHQTHSRSYTTTAETTIIITAAAAPAPARPPDQTQTTPPPPSWPPPAPPPAAASPPPAPAGARW